MTTGNTTLLGLALPVEGELDGTWGDVVNDSITSLLDSAIAGTTTLSADADVTLTTTVLAANQARQAIIRWTASNGATTRNITAPAQSKPYIVINAGTGSIVLRGAGPTTGITIVAGERCVAAWSGSDFVKISSTAISNLTSGVLQVVNGGTGVTTSTGSGNAVLSNSPTLVTPALGTPSSATLTNATDLPIVAGTTGTLSVARGGTGATTLTGLVLGNGTFAMSTVTAPSGVVVGTTDTQTLTNKRITPRIDTVASASTITPTGDSSDQYNVTALAVPATIAAPSGTPTDGQKLVLRIKDNGTAQTISWAAGSGGYRAIGTLLPLTTVANKVIYVGMLYNASENFWDVPSVVTQT